MLKKLRFNKKGQSALEYLLLIAGALLVAIAVIFIINSINKANREDVSSQQQSYSKLIDDTIVPPMISEVSCDGSTDEITVSLTPSPTDGVKAYCVVVDGNTFSYAVCKDAANQLTFNIFGKLDLQSGQSYDISLSAQKNEVYSIRSKPAMTCTVN